MTSTILADASPAAGPSAHTLRAQPGRGLAFPGVLRSEWIKLSSLRSIRVTIVATVLSGLALSALIAASMGEDVFGPGDAGLRGFLLMAATFSAPFLALVFGVFGVFAISSEYSSGMILSTLAAVPRRTPVFVAKAIVLALIAAVMAFAVVAGGLAVAVALRPESAAQLGSGAVISGGLGTVAYLVLIALFAFGVAGLLRSTAGGISVVAGVTFVLPVGFQVLSMTGWEWVDLVAAYLPISLGGTIGQGLGIESGEPGYWGSLAAMLVWAAVAVVPAAILFKRRDAR